MSHFASPLSAQKGDPRRPRRKYRGDTRGPFLFHQHVAPRVSWNTSPCGSFDAIVMKKMAVSGPTFYGAIKRILICLFCQVFLCEAWGAKAKNNFLKQCGCLPWWPAHPKHHLANANQCFRAGDRASGPEIGRTPIGTTSTSENE